MTGRVGNVPPGFDAKSPLSFFVTIYEVLVKPGHFFSRFYSRELDDTTSPLVYALICSLLAAAFGIFTVLFTPLPEPVGGTILGEDRFTVGIGLVVTIALVLVLSLVYLVIGTVVLHLLTLPFIRMGEGIKATFVVVAYGANTISLISWIPVVGYVAMLYGIYVIALGLRETNETTTVRALIPALIFVALQIALTWPGTTNMQF